MSQSKQTVLDSLVGFLDSLVGKPFMLLPGTPAEHVIAGETHQGAKLRVGGVQTVWNDMLLMDAIEGAGYYARTAGENEKAFLELAERLYEISAADGLKHWLTLPNVRRACEWPGPKA